MPKWLEPKWLEPKWLRSWTVAALFHEALQTRAGALEEVERQLVRDALTSSLGNISEAARQLGITRRGLYLKMARFGLDSKDEPEFDPA